MPETLNSIWQNLCPGMARAMPSVLADVRSDDSASISAARPSSRLRNVLRWNLQICSFPDAFQSQKKAPIPSLRKRSLCLVDMGFRRCFWGQIVSEADRIFPFCRNPFPAYA